MAWSSDSPSYCGWNELHVKNAKGKIELHYYLERKDGCADLAVIGRMKNSKRMSFRYALKKNRSVLKKLNSREDVVYWLNSIVSGVIPHAADVPATVMTEEDAGGLDMSTYLMNGKFQEPIHPTKTFSWMGSSWTCRKRRKHYPSFLRNGVRISVNDFVYVFAEQNKRLVAYLEDLFEDSKGNRMVVVQWFHKTDEVGGVLANDDVNDREIFFSLWRQDLNIECIDGLATVLTPQHYEKFLKVPMHVQRVAYFCQKLYEDDVIKPYDITKLEGYWRQEILEYLNLSILKSGEGAQAPGSDPGLGASLVGCVGIRSRKRRRTSAVDYLNVPSADDMKGDWKLSPDSVLDGPDVSMCRGAEDDSSHHIKKGSLIEVLSEDSGIRGCWFRALVIKKHKDKVKVQYQDIQNADDESKKTEEWISTSQVVSCDHLGLRIPGRKAVRPILKPSKENDGLVVSVGMTVDVWWCDGWWEGIVVQKMSDEKFKVYLPGEKMISAFCRSDLRQSLEWLEDEWVNFKSRSDLVSYVLTLMKKKEMEVKHDERQSGFGLGSKDGMPPNGEAKGTISLPVATTKKSLPKRPIPDLLKDVLVTSDLRWKKSSRKRNRVVSCCPHEPRSADGLSRGRSLDCENCQFMGDSLFGSSVGQPLTGLLMSR